MGERLVQRHIDIDPRCKKCGRVESITHLLFQCEFPQKVWLLAPLANELDLRGMIDLQTTWPSICFQKTLPPAGVTNDLFVPWIFWVLWKARNRFVFESHFASAEDTLTYAIALAREWSIHGQPDTKTTTSCKRRIVPARGDEVVIRTDAAWNSTTRNAGLGWVVLQLPQHREFRDSRDYVSSSLLTEGLALREAVSSARALGLKCLRFESDSIQLINCINAGGNIAELHSIVSDVLSLSSSFDFVSFVWISREKNFMADSFTKKALYEFETLVVVDAINVPN